MKKTTLLSLLFAFALSAFSTQLIAQEVMTLGKEVKMKSTALGEERNLRISLPASYEEGDKKYPVFYVLDGEWNFAFSAMVEDYLFRAGKAPEMIVVGIDNMELRERDYSPPIEENSEDKFMSFLEKDLIPYINKNYRTNNYKILNGFSRTGMYTVYTLFTNPDLFDAYIATSPGIAYQNNFVIKKAKEQISIGFDKQKFLYMSLGREPNYYSSVGSLIQTLQQMPNEQLEWEYEYMAGDDHGSTPLKTVYNGLEAIFEGMVVDVSVAEGGAEAIEKAFNDLSEKYGYDMLPPEGLINQMGYNILETKDYDKAIGIFRLNVSNYPDSANVYDSLGEAYEGAGKLKDAMKNYGIAADKAESDDPNLKIFKENYERVKKALKK